MGERESGLWDGRYKIPWDEPGFSRRMLAEHLSQEHDLASRRTPWIDRQAAWIHERACGGRPCRVLDLGCGPGLYSHRLAAWGHRCRGIDFGPASIEYARQHNPDKSLCEFVLGDLREAAFGGPYDLAMLLYGEMNVFSPGEVRAILHKTAASLAAGGRLLVEAQTAQAVEAIGRSEPSEQEYETGLFADGPHRCRMENRWLAEARTAVQTFHVTEAGTGRTQVYRSTTRAWADAELTGLLTEAGLTGAQRAGDWPCNTDGLAMWTAERA